MNQARLPVVVATAILRLMPDPWFEIHLFDSSPVFRVQDIKESFAATGGVVVTDNGPPGAGLGMPTVQ